MYRLTGLQAELLDALQKQVEEGDVNFRSLAGTFGIHPTTLREHLDAIARKGYLEIKSRGPGRNPYIRLLATGVPTPQSAPDQIARARVDALNDLAWKERHSDSRRALSLSEEAYTLAKSLDYRLGLARSLNIRGRCQLRLANSEAALKDASEALAQFEALADDEGTEEALTTLGIIESDLGHFTEALSYFLARYQLCRGRGDAREATALGNLGIVHDYLGDYATGLDYHLRGWRVSKGCGDALGEKFSLNNVGYMHYRLGQYEEALTHYFKALTFEHVGDRNLHALLLDNIGLAYEKLGTTRTP